MSSVEKIWIVDLQDGQIAVMGHKLFFSSVFLGIPVLEHLDKYFIGDHVGIRQDAVAGNDTSAPAYVFLGSYSPGFVIIRVLNSCEDFYQGFPQGIIRGIGEIGA